MEKLAEKYKKDHEKILSWLQKKFVFKKVDLPLFSSIDIRNFGHKVAHVDLNLFPSGFNNIGKHAKNKSIEICNEYFSSYYSGISKIAIYPEQFSRNKKYLENLKALCEIIEGTKRELRVIINDEIFAEMEIGDNRKIRLSEFESSKSLHNNNIIILNNDLTAGVPEFLVQHEGPIIPSPKLGWHSRRKSEHFIKFNQIVQEIGKQFDFDPWLISNYNDICTNIDFRERKNLEHIAESIDKMISQIKSKYQQYNITSDPYVFVKSDQGTFGLGIMTAKSGDEIIQINKKKRHSMQKIKLGIENTQVLIQEGVPTINKTENGHTSEEIIYSVLATPTCIFDRINAGVDKYSNLNSIGMVFGNQRELKPCDIRYLISKIANIATVYEEY